MTTGTSVKPWPGRQWSVAMASTRRQTARNRSSGSGASSAFSSRVASWACLSFCRLTVKSWCQGFLSFGTVEQLWRGTPPRACLLAAGRLRAAAWLGSARAALKDGAGPCRCHDVIPKSSKSFQLCVGAVKHGNHAGAMQPWAGGP